MDPSELRQIAETLDPSTVVETEDFSNSSVTPVGRYVSRSREIAKINRKPDGTVTIELHFTGGIVATNNGGHTYASGQYPLRHWVSTKLYSLPDRPGKTSGVAQYLKALGFETKGRPVAELLQAVGDTLQQEIGVVVGRTDRGEKQPDGSYTNANLRTKDFQTGVDEAGEATFGLTAVKSGVTYQAKEKIQGFFPVS